MVYFLIYEEYRIDLDRLFDLEDKHFEAPSQINNFP
jgi:hypothetical protein